mgnify:CR=1 FL=1
MYTLFAEVANDRTYTDVRYRCSQAHSTDSVQIHVYMQTFTFTFTQIAVIIDRIYMDIVDCLGMAWHHLPKTGTKDHMMYKSLP